MSGYANSGCTESAYEDRRTLRLAVQIIRERRGATAEGAFLSGRLEDFIGHIEWEDEP